MKIIFSMSEVEEMKNERLTTVSLFFLTMQSVSRLFIHAEILVITLSNHGLLETTAA